MTNISLKNKHRSESNHTGGILCGPEKKNKYSGSEKNKRVWDQKPILHSLRQVLRLWD